MRIFGLQKTTLLDYPGKLASIIFTGGCNMNCPYCHNSELIHPTKTPPLQEEEVLNHLKKRQHTLEGLVISGGECTLQKDLIAFCEKVCNLGYDIKLDTNGTSPGLLKELVANDLIRYVAMDIKNSKKKYAATVGCPSFDIAPIEESVSFLRNSSIDYEFRTTVVAQFHEKEDFESMGRWLEHGKAFYIQPFKDCPQVLQKGLLPPKDEELLQYKEIMSHYIEKVEIRGLDL